MPGWLRAALVAALLAAPAAAHDYRAGTIVIDHPWARETAPGQANGAAYMTLRNEGADPDRLVAARAAFARAVELHTHSVDAQGVMRMRQVSAIDVDPGAEVSLQPGGLHLMLLGLETRLVAETLVPLTLVFERAGDIEIELEIGSMRSRPGHDHRHTH